MERVRLTKATEVLALRCAGATDAAKPCGRNLGAVHVIRWGRILRTVAYPDKKERADHDIKVPPAETLTPLPGWQLDDPWFEPRAACPTHGPLVVDLDAVVAALDANHRGLQLHPIH